MNTGPVVGQPYAFAVLPVVDYEPPAQEVPPNAAACRRSSRAPSLRRSSHAPRRPHPPGRPATEPRAAASPQMRQAAAFADAALRRVLEVIDRRRPAAQLRPLLTPSLVDSVVALGHTTAGHEGAAVLRRMRLQPAGHGDPQAAAEVSGSYSRGDRIHAIACRVERAPGGGGRWLVVALHIG
ncbi:Rv3235 family protein [Mycobacterium sp. E3247]|uniref:Rv3235 family protein n=1 Tax=Mycobacterium sp. E3247 TaxID=1856864 RepID=UPI000A864B3B|nr:Rv3235 family protein [Mycobacterium sp. E3247]